MTLKTQTNLRRYRRCGELSYISVQVDGLRHGRLGVGGVHHVFPSDGVKKTPLFRPRPCTLASLPPMRRRCQPTSPLLRA